jgi:hypothetical protein
LLKLGFGKGIASRSKLRGDGIDSNINASDDLLVTHPGQPSKMKVSAPTENVATSAIKLLGACYLKFVSFVLLSIWLNRMLCALASRAILNTTPT